MLNDILVHIPTETHPRPVIDGAISLAAKHNAHLDAVSIGYEAANVGFAIEGGSAVAAIYEIERERALAEAKAAIAIFEAEARQAGVKYGSYALSAIPAESTDILGARSRLYDLTILLQPNDDRSTFDNTIVQELLFECGGPVLFIPYTHKGPIAPKHVGIAWDGSRVAARALRDAAPFLAEADVITIISVNEDKAQGAASSDDVASHLARKGFKSRFEHMNADRAEIQPMILSLAADVSLDLIVMGGYGHSRLQERVLGGVTRDMLQSMTLPVLMSH